MLYISNIVLDFYNKINKTMKKIIILFVVVAILLVSIVIWALQADLTAGLPEILMLGSLLLVIGFALFFGFQRLRSYTRNEPLDDELSRKEKTKASSLSFYISLYLWLVVMYIGDKTEWETHTLIGAGIMGMALTFFLSWLGVRLYGMRNG